MLTNTGIKITPNIKQTIIHEKVLLLVEFYDLYHRTPTQNEVYKNIKLGKFLHNIQYRNTNLPFEDKQLLINTGIKITSNKRLYTIHEKVLLLIEFYNLYNRTPKQNEIYKDIKLGTFLMNVRKGHTTLSTEDAELLINTGIRITINKKKLFQKN